MIRVLLQSLEAVEEQLMPMRKQLHQLLGLPMDRPMLRIANAMSFDDAAGEACSIFWLTYRATTTSECTGVQDAEHSPDKSFVELCCQYMLRKMCAVKYPVWTVGRCCLRRERLTCNLAGMSPTCGSYNTVWDADMRLHCSWDQWHPAPERRARGPASLRRAEWQCSHCGGQL